MPVMKLKDMLRLEMMTKTDSSTDILENDLLQEIQKERERPRKHYC